MNVELHIDRLVLDGLPVRPGDRAALAGTLGDELRLLIETGGVPPELIGGGAVRRLTAPLAPVSPTAAASPLGRAIARSVYASLGR
jgi:hypothetical protein